MYKLVNSIVAAILLVGPTLPVNARYDKEIKEDCCDCDDDFIDLVNDDFADSADLVCAQTFNGQNFMVALVNAGNNGVGWGPAQCLYSNNQAYTINGYIAPQSGPWNQYTYGHYQCYWPEASYCVMKPF